MTGRMWMAVTCGLLMAADNDDATKKEYARFEGVWSFAVVKVVGRKQPDAPFETNKIIFDNDGHFIVMHGPRITRGKLTVDLSKSPKRMDITITGGPAKGRTTAAIYELKDDTYTFCASIRRGATGHPGQHARKRNDSSCLEA